MACVYTAVRQDGLSIRFGELGSPYEITLVLREHLNKELANLTGNAAATLHGTKLITGQGRWFKLDCDRTYEPEIGIEIV